MKIYSKYNLPDEVRRSKYHSDLPSMTVPDQSLSVRELLERFTTGLLTPQSVWHEDIGDDFSDLDNPNPMDSPDFDLTDRDAVAAAAADAKAAVAKLSERRQRSKKEATQSDKEPATQSDKEPTP